jgi:hypothetical protein
VSAVGDEHLPGDPARLLGREEGDGRRDVGGNRAAGDRLQHLHELERLRVLAGEDALRRRQAGSDRVDGDPVRAELARERPREREDAALRRRVVREVRRAGEDHVRRDVDDAAVAVLAHRLLRVVVRQERAVQVDGHDPPPLGEVDLVPRREGDDRRDVDEHVEPPVPGHRLVDESLDVVLARDVGLDRRPALDVGADDGRPFLLELVRHRLADALLRAGDDRDPVVELSHVPS